jgi:uncharacterized FAD-dependent dehydrogenase
MYRASRTKTDGRFYTIVIGLYAIGEVARITRSRMHASVDGVVI